MFVRIAIAVGLALALAGCGEPSDPPAGDGDPAPRESIDGGWRLVDGRGPDGPIPKGDEIEITLEIDGTTIGGRSACNQYFSDVIRDGERFEVQGVGGTEMGCPGVRMEAEALYVQALSAVKTHRMEGDVLVLSGPEVELLYKEIPPVPTAELIDTEWQLNGLIYGSGPEGTVSSAQPATLMLASDGTLTGTTGCRDLEGRWEDRSGHIAVPELSASGKCPPELREQDGHVVQVIGDGFTVEIDESSMTVTDVLSPNGLMYITE